MSWFVEVEWVLLVVNLTVSLREIDLGKTCRYDMRPNPLPDKAFGARVGRVLWETG